MKKLIFIILSILLIVSTTFAAPFLVCDIPPADQQVQGVKGEVDGTAFTTLYKTQGSGILIYDIGVLSPAKHSFTNIRLYNIRGESTTVPFDLPAVPGSPLNIRLTP